MKRYFSILILFLAISILGSCVSFKVSPLLPPENLVVHIAVCRKIDDSGDLLKPLDVQSEYIPEDKSVACFIRLEEVTREVLLRWKWYSPHKKMIRDTGNIVVNSDGKYIEVVTAYDRCKIDLGGDNIEGQWTASVFVNNNFVGKKTFHVRLLKKDIDFWTSVESK